MQGLRFTGFADRGEVFKVIKRHEDLTEFWWCSSTYEGREGVVRLCPDDYILENRLPNRRYDFKSIQATYFYGDMVAYTISRKMWDGSYVSQHYAKPRNIASIQSFIKDRTPTKDITAGFLRIVVYDHI